MSNHITIEFCKEDRQRIDELIGLAGWITGALKDLAAAHPVDAVSPHATPDPDQLSFFDGTPEPVATVSEKEKVEPGQVNYTKADVQALVMKLAAPGTGKKDAVKAIVNEYAKKISDIPEDKLNEVMAKLTKLAEEE